MQDQSFALQLKGPPKIIHWDEKWPEKNGIVTPIITYMFGVSPKNKLPKEHENTCPISIRPEVRLELNGQVEYSAISECVFMIHILKPKFQIPGDIFYSTIEGFIHPWLSHEFVRRTGRNIESYYNLQENRELLIQDAERALRDAGW